MVRAATAVFGAAVAIGIAPLLQFRAAPGELPGALPADGLSPAGPVVQFSALLVFIIAFAIVGNIAARYLNGIRWATVSYCAALFASPLPLMHFGNLRHVLLHGIVATGIVLARKLNPRFSRDDVVLLPVFLATYFAFLDIEFGKTAIATFERAAIAVFVLRLLVRRPLAFAAAPLAFLFEINGLEPHPQDHARATYAPKLTRDTARIRWTDPAEPVARLIRGLDPRPGAWSELDGREVKLFGARAVEGRGAPGEVQQTDDGLRITTGQGAVRIEEVQPAGKARMAAAEWVRGRGAQAGQRFG